MNGGCNNGHISILAKPWKRSSLRRWASYYSIIYAYLSVYNFTRHTGIDSLIPYMYNLAMPGPYSCSFYRYLPAEPDMVKWGMYVMDAGHAVLSAGTPYPAGHHPDRYAFSWENGRRLSEYQLVYITEGSGQFESQETGPVAITGGQVILLYPGIWHRYRPDPSVGWAENWIGFNGDVADRIMRHFFSPKEPVIHVGHDQELLHVIHSISGLMAKAPAGYQQVISARTMEALALVRFCAMQHLTVDRKAEETIQKARQILLQHHAEPVDLQAMAARLGLSYSRFRKLFKKLTGMAPHHYLLDIRLNKACYLLRDSDLSIAQIAEITGFSSQFYFSCLFRRWKNCTPSDYRVKRS